MASFRRSEKVSFVIENLLKIEYKIKKFKTVLIVAWTRKSSIEKLKIVKMLKSSKLKRNKFNYNIVYSVQVKR